MKRPGSRLIFGVFVFILALTPAFGAQWQAKVGADTKNHARQALAFLPNEIWIHEGDSISWIFETDEIHTVTFLTEGQVRPPFPVGCPGFAVGSAMFDGSTCITTPPMVTGQTFTVMFPTVGNFKLTCLVHEGMTGVVHVLANSAKLPHEQAFYDKLGAQQAQDLLASPDLSGAHHHNNSANAQLQSGSGRSSRMVADMTLFPSCGSSSRSWSSTPEERLSGPTSTRSRLAPSLLGPNPRTQYLLQAMSRWMETAPCTRRSHPPLTTCTPASSCPLRKSELGCRKRHWDRRASVSRSLRPVFILTFARCTMIWG